MFRVAALLLLAVSCLSAQVTVPVVVRDRDGHTVSGLHQADFRLFDKGVAREMASFSAVTTPAGPNTTAWLIDDAHIDLGALTRLRIAAARYVGALPPGDRVGIFTTSCRLTIEFTVDRDKLRDALAHLEYDPSPACHAPELPALVAQMAAMPGRRGMVLISPGLPLASADASDLIDSAIRTKVAIDVMDVGHAGAALAEIARGTGGAYTSEMAFEKLTAPSGVYLLTIAPDAGAEGGFHPVRVEIRGARKLNVQARDGYFVKAKAVVEEVAKTPERRKLADAVRKPVVVAVAQAPAAPVVKPETPAAAPAPAAPAKPKGPPLIAIMSAARFGTFDPFAAPIDESEITSRDEPLAFDRGSNLMLLPVVVRGAQGHTVGTLRKEDFRVTDNGERARLRGSPFARPAPRRGTSPICSTICT